MRAVEFEALFRALTEPNKQKIERLLTMLASSDEALIAQARAEMSAEMEAASA